VLTQGRLWPLQIVQTEPAPFGTADCKSIGVGDDGMVYILKRVKDGQHVPVSEFICTQLAAAIGLPVPVCTIAVLPGDARELCFASREEAGVINLQSALQMLLHQKQLAVYVDRLMQWYAFDVFTHNVDRHMGNFLFRHSMAGAVMLGMDFSRALLTQGWPRHVPPLPDCNTTQLERTLNGIAPYPPSAAAGIMNRLASAPDDWLDSCLSQVPAPWADAKLRTRLCRWWRHGRPKRLRLLRSHLTNGRYLQLLPHSRGAGPAPR
jgi:hypothetical protein